MSRFQSTQTVASVVAEAPRTARVFERHGIDFCCGGKVALEQACVEKGVSANVLLDELERAATVVEPGRRDWRAARAGEVVQHVLDVHHAFVKRELPRLGALMDKVERVHGAAHPTVIPPMARLWRQLSMELAMHLRKEEEILFPAIRALDEGHLPAHHCGVEGPVRVMELEHEDHGRLLARLRALSRGYVPPEEACGSWRALWAGLDEFEKDLHVHVHLENEVLFPKSRELVEASGAQGHPHCG